MKFTKTSIACIALISIILSSCFDAPNFPDEPQIEFSDVFLKERINTSTADSLVVVVTFEDGDGDLGLSNTEINPPYNEFNYPRFNGQLITLADRSIPELDTLPPFAFPYTCLNWAIEPLVNNNIVEDTVYFQFNENFFNFFVEVLEQQPSGEFETVNTRLLLPPDCLGTLDGRFPRLGEDSEGDNAKEGTIRFAIPSFIFGFKTLFGGESVLKIRLRIKDRALNTSNTVESPEFTLNDITI
ncbi:MAG: hypothetical protein AAFX87_02270 [Bacteroidota bacterium]